MSTVDLEGHVELPRWVAEDPLGPCEDCGDPIDRGQICGTMQTALFHDDCLERLGH